MINLDKLKYHPRYVHSLGVMEMALKLNKYYKYNIDEEKIKLASLLHDITKPFSDSLNLKILKESFPDLINEKLLESPQIWHSFTGSAYVKNEFGINDQEILDAIFYHTTGREKMTNLEKIIFLSDYIEMGRTGECFEKVRKIAFQNIDLAIVTMLEEQIDYLQKKKLVIYPLSLETYKYYKEVIK